MLLIKEYVLSLKEKTPPHTFEIACKY